MILRGAQVRQLSQASRERFVARLAAHVRRRFPGQTAKLTEKELDERLRKTLDEAAGYGIRIENDVRRFAEYRLIYGWDFPAAPAHEPMQRILRAAGTEGTAKMDRLDDYVTFARAGS